MTKLLSFFAIILFATSSFALNLSENQKIVALLDLLDQPGIMFIRNGEAHKGSEARKHLEDKMRVHPVKTAKAFIEEIASTSSQTGKPYMVRFSDGKQVEAGKWLSKKLAEFEN